MPISNQRRKITTATVFMTLTGSTAIAPQWVFGSESESRDCKISEKAAEQTAAQKKVGSSAEKSPEWLTHAQSSFEQWQQGNTQDAVREGEEALRLNPTNETVLLNLALMKQRAQSFDEANALYWQAVKLHPNNWVAPLGMARCFILAHDESNSREILKMMSEKNDCDFSWYYMTAKTWLEIDDLSMAEKTANRALKAATRQEEKSAAENLLFLTLLRADKIEQAKNLMRAVIEKNSSHNPEIYLRSADKLLSVNDPMAGGEMLLASVVKNFPKADDAETFLKLGLIFQKKADDKTCSEICRRTWLKCAQKAFTQAAERKPESPDYHYALASALVDNGEESQAVFQLEKFGSLDRHDLLAPFLIPKMRDSKAHGEPIPVNLTLAKFRIDGLNCSCHLAKIHNALASVPGIAFISTPPQKPYSGFVLVDSSITAVPKMISQCNESALPPELGANGQPVKVTLTITAEEPVKTASDALKIAGAIRFAPIAAFEKSYSEYVSRFQEVQPIAPTYDGGQSLSLATKPGWEAPL